MEQGEAGLGGTKGASVQAEPPDYEGLAELAYSRAFKILRHREDARDVVSGTMTAFLLLPYNPDSPPAWVSRVAQNLALNAKRDRGLRRERTPSVSTPPDPRPSGDFVNKLVARLLVDEVLRRLPPRQREAITWRYLMDERMATVADILGVSVETAKTHVQRALDRAREILATEGEEAGSRG